MVFNKDTKIAVPVNMVIAMRSSVVGRETITVPAGTFNNAVKMMDKLTVRATSISANLRTTDLTKLLGEKVESVSTAWLVEGVGIIQLEDEDGLAQLVRYEIK